MPSKTAGGRRGRPPSSTIPNSKPKPSPSKKGKPRQQKWKPVSAYVLEVAELLNDLANLLGVGTVIIAMPRRAAAGMEAPDGWLWLETPETKPNRGSLEFCMHELCEKRVIRCTYRMVGKATALVRVYVLPEDVGRGLFGPRDQKVRSMLKKVVDAVDVSEMRWSGKFVKDLDRKPVAEDEDERSSLFYMFNTLESPKPDPDAPWIKDVNTKLLLRDVLKKESLPGLKTKLYEYQKRSVAMMLQRELAPMHVPDTRLREIRAPTGEIYYIDLETTQFYEKPSYFDDVRGGILAEEMGTGKTLMCLALVLATQHQFAYVPEELALENPIFEKAPTLMESCVASIWRNAVPFGQYENQLSERCLRAIRSNPGHYEVLTELRARTSRSSAAIRKQKIFLGRGTLVVAPANLVEQWWSEITKHIKPGKLKALVLATPSCPIPSVQELLEYDIVILSHARFQAEEKAGRDAEGRREHAGISLSCACAYIGATRTRECHCFDRSRVYESPLMGIRWKRLIVDEGHVMGGTNRSNALCVAEKIPVERRWIVSGTPSSGLLGVAAGMTEKEGETDAQRHERMKRMLAARKECEVKEAADLDRLGRIVQDFLRCPPWASVDGRGKQASWTAYITKGFTDRRAGATTCVRNLLNRLMIRHSQADIEESVALPPLRHRYVRLQPGHYEKLSLNLFLAALASNAVTSEREGTDYMFHPQNRGHLRLLVNNLQKQAGFYWSGWSAEDVDHTVTSSLKHLEMNCNALEDDSKDKALLNQAVRAGRAALDSRHWNVISEYNEMGFFVDNFPVAKDWTHLTMFDSNNTFDTSALTSDHDNDAPLLGGTQLLEIQKWVSAHAYLSDDQLLPDLGTEGRTTLVRAYDTKCEQIYKAEKKERHGKRKGPHADDEDKSFTGVPNMKSKPAGTHKLPRKSHDFISKNEKGNEGDRAISDLLSVSKPSATGVKSALKTTDSTATQAGTLAPDSALASTLLLGTASVKLSYLMSQVRKYSSDEKILIFYEADDVGFYIAQALEILAIPYLAYQKALPAAKKASYLVTFLHTPRFRVLLMDLSQAAHGLNVAIASRVYFVGPVWQPAIEAQALKRAHRIGQTREVVAETLVLEGTLEEAVIRRREEMSEAELRESKDSVDDGKMRAIIEDLAFLPHDAAAEGAGFAQIAPLDRPEPLFSAEKRGTVYNPADLVAVAPSSASSSSVLPASASSPARVSLAVRPATTTTTAAPAPDPSPQPPRFHIPCKRSFGGNAAADAAAAPRKRGRGVSPPVVSDLVGPRARASRAHAAPKRAYDRRHRAPPHRPLLPRLADGHAEAASPQTVPGQADAAARRGVPRLQQTSIPPGDDTAPAPKRSAEDAEPGERSEDAAKAPKAVRFG